MSQKKAEKNEDRQYVLAIRPSPTSTKLIMRISDLASEDSDILDEHIIKLAQRLSQVVSNADILIYEHWCLTTKSNVNSASFKNNQRITSCFWQTKSKFIQTCHQLGLDTIVADKKKYPLISLTARLLMDQNDLFLPAVTKINATPRIKTPPSPLSELAKSLNNISTEPNLDDILESELEDDVNELDEILMKQVSEIYHKNIKGKPSLKILTKKVYFLITWLS